jgi:hypothetical protein
MKLLITQFPQISRHIIPLWSKYSPQHPVLKHPQSMFLPYYLLLLRIWFVRLLALRPLLANCASLG